jgi:hypothetical protein
MSKRDRRVAFREEVEMHIPEKRQKGEDEEAYEEEEIEKGRSEWALFRV